jgi:GNAT superfamily N-acetyltransferase
MVRQPWQLRSGATTMLVRGARPRDLEALAAMHHRCSAQSLLERYQLGGRGPSVPALQRMLLSPLSFVAVVPEGRIIAIATAVSDEVHGWSAAKVGVLVEDEWQGQGIGTELISQVAGGALVCGYSELISYPAEGVFFVQRMLREIAPTHLVGGHGQPHLHTTLPESAALGLGAVRERMAS